MDTNIPSTGFLRLPQILKLFPINKSTWSQGCRTSRYPQPVKLGPRTTVWRAEDIRELIQSVGKGENDEK